MALERVEQYEESERLLLKVLRQQAKQFGKSHVYGTYYRLPCIYA